MVETGTVNKTCDGDYPVSSVISSPFWFLFFPHTVDQDPLVWPEIHLVGYNQNFFFPIKLSRIESIMGLIMCYVCVWVVMCVFHLL